MSTSETDEYAIGKCACGKGQVIKTIVTQDNPWSGADISFRVECRTCPGTWDLDRSGHQMTLRSSLVAPQKASDALMITRQKLHEYLRGLASQSFAAQSFKTKKAEHAHLLDLGIANGSYQTYLRDRKGNPMHNVAALSKNAAFVRSLVDNYGDEQKYKSLLAAVDSAEIAYRTASANIVRYEIK